MIQRQPFKHLFFIMAAAALLVSAVTIASLYQTAIEQHRLNLAATVKNQAQLLEAIAGFDNPPGFGDAATALEESTLKQIADAHRQFRGFGESGEFILARKESDQIIFMLSHGEATAQTLHSIPFDGEWAEPMRHALSGESGVIIGLDYEGTRVLAAYEPIPASNLGLVAKIDISDIRAPFIKAGLIAILAAMLIIFIASRWFFQVARPIMQAIDRQAETFTTLAETSLQAIFLTNTRGEIEYLNSSAAKTFGYEKDELMGTNVSCLMPNQHAQGHDQY
ncbi:MAG: PAS domain S-box protein, partial [Pseudomonadota bacterium]